MKLIFLNTWNGKLLANIKDFIKENLPSTDVFCFQEVYEEMKVVFQDLLESHQGFFAYKRVSDEEDFLQATYVKKSSKVKSTQVLLKNEPYLGLGLNILIEKAGKQISIGNFHGLSQPGNKLDTPKRLEQSKLLIESLGKIPGPQIIGGDLNLEVETESIRIFEEHGYRNLIKEFSIPTTRNKYAWERYPSRKQYFSDFVLVSPEIEIISFSVPNLEISDHLPLILNIKV